MLSENMFYEFCSIIVGCGVCTFNDGFMTVYTWDDYELTVMNLGASQSLEITIGEGEPTYTSCRFVYLNTPTRLGNYADFSIYHHEYNPCRYTFYDSDCVFNAKFANSISL